MSPDSKVIVVDGGSSDNSVSSLMNTYYEHLDNKLTIITGRFKTVTDALLRGLQEVDTEYTIFMDSDGSHSPVEVFMMASELRIHDMVLGTRIVSFDSRKNRVVSIIGNLLTYPLCRDIKDRMTGFFGIRTALARSVKIRTGIKPCLQFLIRCKPSSVGTVYYQFYPRSVGKSSHGRFSSFSTLFDIALLYLTKFLKPVLPYVGIPLSLVFLGILIKIVDWALVWSYLTGVPVSFLFLIPVACSIYFLTFIARKHRWLLYLEREVTKTEEDSLFDSLIIGYALNFVLPSRLGEAARILLVKRYIPSLNWKSVTGSVLLVKIFDSIVLWIFIGVGLLILGYYTYAGLVGLLVIFQYILIRLSPRLAQLISRGWVHSFLVSVSHLRDTKRVTRTFKLSFAVWVLEFLAYLLLAVGLQVSFLSISFTFVGILLVVVGLTNLMQGTPSGPGSFGNFELFGSIGLSLLGVPLEEALVYIFLTHICLSGFIFLLGMGLLLRRDLPSQFGINYLWNLGHDNDDGDFDWWEWYGPHRIKRTWKRKMGAYILDMVGKPKSLLSLGCGSSPILNLFVFTPEIVGVDINPAKIKFLEGHKLAQTQLGVEDITNPGASGLLPRRVDTVICNEVLEHLSPTKREDVITSMCCYATSKIVVSIPDYSNKRGFISESIMHGGIHEKIEVKNIVEVFRTRGWKLVDRQSHKWDTVLGFGRIIAEET